MILKNAIVVTPTEEFKGYVKIDKKGDILEINHGDTKLEGYDCKGHYLMPGFIDSHTHGGYGLTFDGFSTNKDYQEKLNTYLNGLLSEGVTGIVPTTVTQSLTDLNKLVDEVSKYETLKHDLYKPHFLGWFFEGPFISKYKKGAHDENKIIKLDEPFLEHVIRKFKMPIVMALAPEENDKSIIDKYKDKIIFALGHSNANYDKAIECLNYEAKRVIHLYNAMSGFSHRDLGIVNAILDNKFKSSPVIEIISDNVHVDNKVVRFTYETLKGKGIVIVSDSLSAKGLNDGPYMLGSLDIEKRDNWCYLRGTNTLAGGCSKYNYLVNQFKKATNCSFPELVRATSTYNEICFGLRKTISESMINKPANFVLVDKDINILTTIINGKIVYERK